MSGDADIHHNLGKIKLNIWHLSEFYDVRLVQALVVQDLALYILGYLQKPQF